MSKRKKKINKIKSPIVKSAFSVKAKCHTKPVEIIKNFYCGSERESLIMVSKHEVDVLVPLHDLDAKIWDLGFRGEILYYPIHDYNVLPEDVVNDLVDKIIKRIKSNKKVGLFCLGGHGRTGYVASIVLGKLGYDDPIEFIRKRYCKNAVESNEQIEQIAKILDKPELTEKYNEYSYRGLLRDYDDWGYFGNYYSYNAKTSENVTNEEVKKDNGKEVCENCVFYDEGKCEMFYGIKLDKGTSACSEYYEIG